MATKAYSYVRFSTPEQQRGDSWRRQTAMAQEYAKQHGLELDQSVTFEDLGVSGYRGSNVATGKLGAFFEAVESGLVEAGSYLLVENLDRISRRTPRKAARVLEDIVELGITVVTLSDGHKHTADSLDDPMSFIWSIMTFARAHEESATKSRRLKAAWEAKRAKVGERPLTSRCPSWLRLDREAGTFTVLEDQAEVVRRIFKMTLGGVGQNAIAETFNREGVPVFGRGKHWHRTFIAKLLQGPAVIGTLVPYKVEYEDDRRVRKPLAPVPGYYPAILDDDTYERVQAMRLNTAAPLRGRHAGGEVRNVLSSLGRCPRCGSTMTRINKGTNGGRPYLVCTTAKAGAGCQYRTVPYEYVERAIMRAAGEITAEVPAGEAEAELDAELENVEGAIDGAEIGLEALLDTLEGAGRSPSAAIVRRITKAEGDLEALRADRNDLRDRRSAALGPMVDRRLADLRAALTTTGELDRGLVNRLLRQLLRGVLVDVASGRLILQWLHGGETTVQYGWPKEGAGKAEQPDTANAAS